MPPGLAVDLGRIPFFMSCVWRGGRKKAGIRLFHVGWKLLEVVRVGGRMGKEGRRGNVSVRRLRDRQPWDAQPLSRGCFQAQRGHVRRLADAAHWVKGNITVVKGQGVREGKAALFCFVLWRGVLWGEGGYPQAGSLHQAAHSTRTWAKRPVDVMTAAWHLAHGRVPAPISLLLLLRLAETSSAPLPSCLDNTNALTHHETETKMPRRGGVEGIAVGRLRRQRGIVLPVILCLLFPSAAGLGQVRLVLLSHLSITPVLLTHTLRPFSPLSLPFLSKH